MEELKDLKRDKNGFVILDGFLTGREKLSLARDINPAINFDIDGKSYFVKEEGGFQARFLPTFLKVNKNHDKNNFVFGDYYIMNELYLSKLAKAMGITSVDYLPAKVKNNICVMSNDYNEMADDVKPLSSYLRNYKQMSLKQIRSLKVEWESNIIPDLEFLALFDFSTLQRDRNYTNVAIGIKGESKLPNTVLGFDYANSGIGLYGYSTAKFEKELDKAGFVTFGIDSFYQKGKDFLDNLSHSKNISNESISKFISKLDEVLVTGKLDAIHAEVKEESHMSEIGDTYKNLLHHTLCVMGEKIEGAYAERI